MRNVESINCPACGGEIHAVAGKCKHCRQNLVELRAKQALAAQHIAPQSPHAPQQQLQPSAQAAPAQAAPEPARSRRPSGTPPHGTSHDPAQTQRAPARRAQPPQQNRQNPAGRAAHHVALTGVVAPKRALWMRWPIWVGSVAIFLLGLSAGMMLERTRGGEPETGRFEGDVIGGSSPVAPLDPMSTSPMLRPSPAPAAPDHLGPTPPSSDPAAPAPTDLAAFTGKFATTVCRKAIDCGMMPPVATDVCESALIDNFVGASKPGGCSFDTDAAATCLAMINAVDCDAGTPDPSDMTRLFAGSVVDCERALRCR